MPIVEGLRMLHHMTGHTHLQSVQSLQLTSTMVFMKNFSSTILVITTAYSDRTDLVIGWNVKLGMSKNPKVLEGVLQWLILMEMAVLSSSSRLTIITFL
jgi:hypothetical protein